MHPYDGLADLLGYPDAVFPALAHDTRTDVAIRSPEAAAALSVFVDTTAALSAAEMEELYTRTFDLQAPCCLEVGWQIFGDTYNRGSFLVRLRLAARDHGVAEASELPDHLATILRVIGRLHDDEDPRGLVQEAVLPAVEKMRASFGDGTNPYRSVLDAIATLLASDFAIDRAALRRGPRHLPLARPEMTP